MTIFTIIVAVSENGVIGNNNQLLWHLSNDLKRFKALTWGKPIVMGRKTFESIGRPLPGRRNIVLSRHLKALTDCEIVHSKEEAIQLLQDIPEVMIIGGAEIYQHFFPLVNRIYLTQVHVTLKGDAFFKLVDKEMWQVIACENHKSDEKHLYDYDFITLERKVD